MHLLISLCVGLAGGYLGMKARIPAGSLIGATVAVILYRMFLDSDWELPKQYGFVLQVMVGVLIAVSYDSHLLGKLLSLWGPILISCTVLICAGLVIAVIFHKMGYLDLPTAYIATSPGAMNVLVAMSGDFNADVALVASFHFVRIFIINMSAPLIFKLLHMHAQ